MRRSRHSGRRELRMTRRSQREWKALLQRAAARAAVGKESEIAAAVHHFVVIHKDRGPGTIHARNPPEDAVEIDRVNERHRYRVVMRRDKSGIAIALTAIVRGEAKSEQYRVTSEAELKEKYPKLFEVHEALVRSLSPPEEPEGMRVWWRQFAPPPEGPGRGGRRGER